MDDELKEQLDRAFAADRYEGRRFLRLLEMYVLESIGQIDEDARITLRNLEPSLQTTFGVTGDWQRILEQVMEFGPEIRSHIKELWDRNREIAKNANQALTPELFARMFVDTNFKFEIEDSNA